MDVLINDDCTTQYICKSKNQQDCNSNIGIYINFMKSEKTLDDTTCMDST